ncbi:MAG: hypothetical protein IJ302_09870, partial [Clostridia bacterium]|nr:hypothetical protein [Clostridia bacterium]
TTDTLPADTPFTQATLRTIADSLEDGQALFSEGISNVFLQTGVQDYFDLPAGTHTFDDPAFTAFLTLYGDLRSDNRQTYVNPDYGTMMFSDNGIAVTDSDPIAALVSGDLKFLRLHVQTAEQLLFLPVFFMDTGAEYNFCGYPTESGGALSMTPGLQVVLPEDAETADGAYAFLRMLFSDTVQACSMMRQTGIPVTQSGLLAAIPTGYHYFDTVTFPQTNGSVHMQLNYLLYGKQSLAAYYPQCRELVLIGETHTQLYETVAGAAMRGECNADILQIVWEEYSAVNEGVRTLPEAVELIVRRAELKLAE